VALGGFRGKAWRKGDVDLRQAFLRFIADFANWDAAGEPIYLEAGRALVKAAHGDDAPLVVDPFAGGGSIPLEALRLGCEAFASDLNPVACLILKVLLEDIPRHGPRLAEELRQAGADIKAAAEKELAEFYPTGSDDGRPIAYLWARTVRCESSGCGAEIPLARSFWLSRKASRRRALRYGIERPKGRAPRLPSRSSSPRPTRKSHGGRSPGRRRAARPAGSSSGRSASVPSSPRSAAGRMWRSTSRGSGPEALDFSRSSRFRTRSVADAIASRLTTTTRQSGG
jgi:hypothetical protein